MTAVVLPFPLARRAGYLRRQAAYVQSLSNRAGERHIARQVEVQRQALLAKGVPAETVEAELSAMSAALWHHLLPGDAA